MLGAIIYLTDIERAKSIQLLFENKFEYPFKLVDYKCFDVQQLFTYEYIVIEWQIRKDLINVLFSSESRIGIAFYNDIFLSDIDETDDIVIQLKDAFHNHNYTLCKGINEFLLLSDLIRKRPILKSYPTKLQIESTDMCNAKCIMCSHAYKNGSGIDPINSGLISRLEPVLPFVNTIILHGNGEPFLKKDISVYLNELSKYGIKFIANTNLSIVSEELINLFNESFIELNISCDGHTPDLYESIRKGLSFDKFIKNVRYVRDRCPDLIMKMSVVLMRQNMEYMSDLVGFALENGFNEVIFNQLCVDEKNGNLQDAAYLYPEKIVKYTTEVIEKYDPQKIRVTLPYALKNSNDSLNVTNSQVSIVNCDGICDWLVEGPYIDLRGNVAVCCIKQKEIVGNLYNDSFEAIWNGEQYQCIRNQFREGLMPASCGGCDFLTQGRLKHLHTNNTSLGVLEKQPRV